MRTLSPSSLPLMMGIRSARSNGTADARRNSTNMPGLVIPDITSPRALGDFAPGGALAIDWLVGWYTI